MRPKRVFAWAWLASAVCLFAQAPDLADFEKRLARIDGQIKDLRAKIEAAARQEASVLGNLARVNLAKSLVQRELAAQNVQKERTNAELSGTQTTIRNLKAELERENESISRTLVTLYKFGRLNFFHFLLRAENFEAYSTASKRLSFLARYQEGEISDYLRSLSDLHAAEARLAQKKRDLAELVRAAGLKKLELEAEERKGAALVQEIRRNRDTYERTLGELKDSADQLQVMMNRILSKEWALPAAFVPMNEKKGKLSWPLEGKVITRFGFERHPHFQTILMNNGVEIAPDRDKTVIQAVHPGKVVYADYFPGYGNLLIIDHGMTDFTLYGHCSEFLAAVGDMVNANQPIAQVGDSGSLKGECLYFELRHRSKPVDPLQWLRRR